MGLVSNKIRAILSETEIRFNWSIENLNGSETDKQLQRYQFKDIGTSSNEIRIYEDGYIVCVTRHQKYINEIRTGYAFEKEPNYPYEFMEYVDEQDFVRLRLVLWNDTNTINTPIWDVVIDRL